MNDLAIELAGERVLLLAQKALYWPRERTLVVADIHFGKAAAFRSLGVPVPAGTTRENLAQLDLLVERYGARQVVFLGDLLHSKAAHARATQTVLLEWRQRHASLGLVLVRGNHDRHAGDPGAALGITLVDEPFMAGPFACCHRPELDAPGYVLAGHVHPVYMLATRFDALRLPCFLVGPRRMILPSFGAFTGGHVISPGPNERVFVSSGESIHSVR